MIKRIKKYLQVHGLAGLLHALMSRLVAPKAKCFDICARLVSDRTGFEIGGPSAIFSARGLLPLYPLAAHIDNCNFSAKTVWREQQDADAGFQFSLARSPGRQYIAEATDLGFAISGNYDFVLSPHALEHCANPLSTNGKEFSSREARWYWLCRMEAGPSIIDARLPRSRI